MSRAKVAISLDNATLERLDRLVEEEVFPNRSQAIEEAVSEKLERLERSRLARECAKLDPVFERPSLRKVCQRNWPSGPNTRGRP